MYFDELTSISPIDGRYRKQTEELATYFSEFALIKWRIFVEVEYFISLFDKKIISSEPLEDSIRLNLKKIYTDFDREDCEAVKRIEKITNHDVKAVEYFLKERIISLGLEEYSEFIHFGLTSQDINNTAIPLMIKKWFQNIYIVDLYRLIDQLETLADDTCDIVILSRTHGQPASPSRMGKEIMVFVERLKNQLQMIEQIKFWGKFGGATGNFNAHQVAYPNIDWVQFGNEFLSSIGLKRYQYTTQIEHYDHLSALFDNLKRIDVILIDFCRDIWQYISMEYFKQKVKEGEVGSSAMPHKVNPIDFENAEGNLGLANSILNHLSEKLPISRLQRDLTDSTVLRNIGVPMSHIKISFNSIKKGVDKLVINKERIDEDLENNWVIISEGIQTILRRERYPKPYEKLKELTRGNLKITKDDIHKFIDELNVNEKVKIELKSLSPSNYSGVFKIN
jgi:adenylosuccinate lyase